MNSISNRSVSNRSVSQHNMAQPEFKATVSVTGKGFKKYINKIQKKDVIDKFIKDIKHNKELENDLIIKITKNSDKIGYYLNIKGVSEKAGIAFENYTIRSTGQTIMTNEKNSLERKEIKLTFDEAIEQTMKRIINLFSKK